MKIEEYAINEYGPLPDRSRIKLNKFNVFFGNNETGKTLTVDALIKILLGKTFTFSQILNRVDEKPIGFISISDESGKEIKLKSNLSLENYIDLSLRDFYNLFVIRDSNLNINDEDELYSSITDRLLGLRLNDIKLIETKLRDLGKLTPGGIYRDKSNEKIKTRINQARELSQEITVLQDKIKGENYEILEEEIHLNEDEIKSIDYKIISLENARKREIYEKATKAITNIDVLTQLLNKYDKFDQETLKKWENCNNEIRIYDEQLNNLKLEHQVVKDEIEELNEDLREQELDFQFPKKIKNFLDNTIYPEKKTYDIKKGEIAGKLEKRKFYKTSFILSTVLFGIFLLFAVFSTIIYVLFISILFALIAVLFWIFTFQIYRENAWLVGYLERLRLNLSSYNLNGETIEEINVKIANFEQVYTKKHLIIEDLSRNLDRLEHQRIDLINEKIPKLNRIIGSNNDSISEIRKKFHVNSIEDFNSNLDEKIGIVNKINTEKTLILNIFEINEDINEEFLKKSKNEVKKYELYKDESKNLKFDEEFLSELNSRKLELEELLKTLNEQFSDIKETFLDIERRCNNFLKLDDNYLYCNTSHELKLIKTHVKDFIEKYENIREDVLDVIEVFNEIAIDEKEKISKLLSEESSVSNYYQRITEGMYDEVKFDMESNRILVHRKDGIQLDAEKISGGAFDQLYFCIRLALGEKLLNDKTGFFILDDPFLKSDNIRLEKQLKMLKDITNLGWQILYFTSKNEIKNSLYREIESGFVNFIEFQPIID